MNERMSRTTTTLRSHALVTHALASWHDDPILSADEIDAADVVCFANLRVSTQRERKWTYTRVTAIATKR